MSSTESILVVDDDPDIRETLSDYLSRYGYRVRGAANGEEALDVLRSLGPADAPCIILLDLMMPVMDGYAFRAEQRKSAGIAAIPVVVITAAGSVRREELAGVTVLTKPLDLGRLMFAVRERC